jgi:hypothetical protein
MYEMEICCRAVLLSVVLRQAAEKFVPLAQPTVVGSNILERPWRDETNGRSRK